MAMVQQALQGYHYVFEELSGKSPSQYLYDYYELLWASVCFYES